jgi:hypothetical protein
MIPRTFSLLGHDVNVVFDPQPDSEDAGMWDSDTDVITVYVATGNADMVGHTFYHELVHAILRAMGRNDLDEDEAFVDLFGGLLWQFAKTAR